MENKKTLFVLLACALCAAVLGEVSLAPAISATDDPNPGTSAAVTTPAPTVTTTVPTTPSSPPTPSTTPPPTPTTLPPTPPPTTVVPPTTAAPPAPPTPTPTPVPADGRGNWTISDSSNNVTCIIAQMILSAKIDYPLDGVNKTLVKTVSVPPSAKASGSCDDLTNQWIKLTWNEDKNSLQVNFTKNDTAKMYFISKIALTFFADNNTFPNISSVYVNKSQEFVRVQQDFMIKVNQSFRCSREQDLPFNHTNGFNVNLALSSVQLQAFHNEHTAMFGTAQDCELDTPDIVPIAVGCALAALVCVVLVAYLIGRRRSQARGYLSM